MELQIQFLEALNPKLASCPQIRAGWLGGSFGRGQADRYSDIDLHLLAENVDSFRSGVKEWLEAISPLVLCRLRFEGRMINALTHSGVRIDVWLHDKAPTLYSGEALVLLDRNSELLLSAKEERRIEAQADVAGILLDQIEEFWRCMSLTPAVIGRREFLVYFSGLAAELQIITDLLMAGYGHHRERGIKVLNTYLGTERRAELERALQLRGLNPESLVGAALELASIVRRHGAVLAERHGFIYPKELEESVLRHLAIELRNLGLDHVWATAK